MGNASAQLVRWLLQFWPVVVAGVVGSIETWGLRSGRPWAYRLGVRVRTGVESHPLATADELPSIDDDSVRVCRIGPRRFGYMLRAPKLSVGASHSSVGAASGSGLCSYGVVRSVSGADGTTFYRETRIALFPFVALGALAMQEVIFGFFAMDAGFGFAGLGLFTALMALAVTLELRRLAPTYDVLTADLVMRGVHSRAPVRP